MPTHNKCYGKCLKGFRHMHIVYSNDAELHPGMHGPVAYILTLVKWRGNIAQQKPFKWRPRGISIKRFCEISCFALKLHTDY